MAINLQEDHSFWLLGISIGIASLFVLVLLTCICKVLFIVEDEGNILGTENQEYNVPNEFLNDEESLVHLAEEFDFTQLSPEEQSAYLRGEEFTKLHPPLYENFKGKSYSEADDLLVKEIGINAFEFEQEANPLEARYIVADKTEIQFHKNDKPYSTSTAILNHALPVKRSTPDTVYFEVKVFEFLADLPNAHFSIGLVTKPYPSEFRLPGYNAFSIAYESTGNLKINKPFPTLLQQHQGENSKFNAQVLPPLLQSDVVGFGYVIPSGTIFITRNGKKLLDVMKGCYVDLYPAIGCFLTNAKFQCNLGQLGFLWIEANVRKYGFISNSDYKKIRGDRGLAALPTYGHVTQTDSDKILEKGEELPPSYPEEELDFFGRSSKDLVRVGSSSKAQNRSNLSLRDEKKDITEKPNDEVRGASVITHYLDDNMDLRERLYEQASENDAITSERAPLIDPEYNVEATYHSLRDLPSSVTESLEKDRNEPLQNDTVPVDTERNVTLPTSQVSSDKGKKKKKSLKKNKRKSKRK